MNEFTNTMEYLEPEVEISPKSIIPVRHSENSIRSFPRRRNRRAVCPHFSRMPDENREFCSSSHVVRIFHGWFTGVCYWGSSAQKLRAFPVWIHRHTLVPRLVFPSPPTSTLASLPLALPSPMARGVDPQQSSLGYIQVRTEIATHSVADRQWNDAEATIRPALER